MPVLSIFDILNSPVVSVPVLSKTTVVIFLNNSKLFALRKRIPFFVALPSPTAIAAGVARPIAQGQLITSTAMLLIKELVAEMSKAK